MLIELTEDNLQQYLTDNAKVMVQYGAGWCGNCKITKPKFKRFSEAHPDVPFLYIDAEKLPNSRAFADVSNLPTFAGLVNGKLVKQGQGNKVELIEEIINEVTSN